MKPNYQGYNYQTYKEFRNKQVGRGFGMYAGCVGLIVTTLGEAPIWVGVIGLLVGIISTTLYLDCRREANYYRQLVHGK